MTTTERPDIYAECIAAGIPAHGRYSDLYIPVTEVTREMVARYVAAGGAKPETFINQVEGGLWYDLPFAYSPYWETKQA